MGKRVKRSDVVTGPNRSYTFNNALFERYEPRRTEWQSHQLCLVSLHRTTHDAEWDHAHYPAWTGRQLDWNWLARKGYVTFN